MTQKIVTTDESGANNYLQVRRMARLYCGYSDNANTLALTQNTWTEFGYPSTPVHVYRSHEWTVEPDMLRFTYTGSSAKWFNLAAVCNILKTNGNPASRTVQFQWCKNGVPQGSIRQSHMNLDDAQIITGVGQFNLQPNDYLEPCIRNVENSDDIVVWNCSFDIKEDPEYAFVI
jgi:hypothetical protein